MNTQQASWPPPPDLDSIRELVRDADPQGHIAGGSPTDEYDPEEEAIFASIAHLPTDQITVANLLPLIEQVWRNSFASDDQALAESSPGLKKLAEQIAHFFGPEAKPQVRSTS